MATNKIGVWSDDWTDNLTTHPSYGAIPPVTITTTGATYDANSMPTISINDNIGLGGYTIGNGGIGGAIGSNTIWTTGTSTTSGSFHIRDSAAALSASGKMQLNGEGADIDINGKSLKAWMERVEERLNILTPNPELEKEWDELRRLGERYRKLEKKCKEKADVWNKLKSMPKPEVKW
jgi:hypothetical protein